MIVRVTREQGRVYQATKFFHDRIPLTIRGEIERVEKDLWEQVNSLNTKDIKEEVVEWVQDPSSIVGCLSTYDCIITTYQVMKGLMSHILMEREKKGAGDVELMNAWKDNNHDSWLMPKK